MSKIITDEDCEKWRKSPRTNPKTGKKLYEKGGPYKKYMERCSKSSSSPPRPSSPKGSPSRKIPSPSSYSPPSPPRPSSPKGSPPRKIPPPPSYSPPSPPRFSPKGSPPRKIPPPPSYSPKPKLPAKILSPSKKTKSPLRTKSGPFTAKECEEWKADPTKNPRTNKKITKSGKIYKELEMTCLRSSKSPKAVSPSPKKSNNARLDKIRHEKETNIFEALVQPFPTNYDILKDNTFSKEIVSFTKNVDFRVAFLRLNGSDGSDHKFIDIMDMRDKIGKDCFYTVTFNKKEISNLDLDASHYLKDLYGEIKKKWWDIDFLMVYNEKYSRDYETGPEIIKKCISGGAKILYLHVYLYVDTSAHSSQVILNVEQKKGWYIDSAGENEKAHEYLKTSIEVYLKHYIDPEYVLESYDYDKCPGVRIQGDYFTCTGWTHYIFALSILNPELTEFDIYKILASYDLKTRNYIIIMFYKYYYDHTHFPDQSDEYILDIIEKFPDKISDKELPSLEYGEKLTFTRL